MIAYLRQRYTDFIHEGAIRRVRDWLIQYRANYARENCCDECADAYLARMKGRGE